jgi:high-affinity iron transporter
MRVAKWLGAGAALLLILGVLVWQAVAVSGNPDPLAAQSSSSAAILVLAAITAGLSRSKQGYGSSIASGAGIGLLATLVTWSLAIAVMDDLSKHISALQIQAATGLLAIVVLLIVMNWFFHKLYWTGWISLHNKKKNDLLQQASRDTSSASKVVSGLALLGFSSVYREGVETVLFLQSYRLRLGEQTVLRGVCIGLLLTAGVGILTFVAHRKLPYRRMLVITGVLLGAVLLVMVGEQVQEMQLAHWLPTTDLPLLASRIPAWMGLWFSVFPNVEGLIAQGLAFVLVLGSYFVAKKPTPSAGKLPAAKRVPSLST